MSDYQLPFPDNEPDWRAYRHRLAELGQELVARLDQARSSAERVRAEEEWNRVVEWTRRTEDAYRGWQLATDEQDFAAAVQRRRERVRADWVSPDPTRPARDPGRQALTMLRFDDGSPAGRPVGLDEEGDRLREMVAGRRIPPAGEAVRMPRENVLALVTVLEEFAARLMADRVEGGAYLQAVLELLVDLETRRSDG